MKLGIISDTHARTLGQVPQKVRTALSRVDLIVHAGDFTEKAVLDGLLTLGQVKAVCGNMDSAALRRLLPQTELFTAGGKRVGLVHGSGAPRGLAERLLQTFDDIDILVYGHSHYPDNSYIGGVLVFNPGRASESFGVLTIGDRIDAEIIPVD